MRHDIDSRTLRNALGQFATGVTIITTLDAQGRKVGMTANSFSSVSLDPPLILWSVAKSAPSKDAFLKAHTFAVNILAQEQIALSNQFARPCDDKFAGVEFAAGHGGVPLIDGAVVQLICATYDTHDAGDHTIILGQVHAMHVQDKPALVFHRGQYAAVRAFPKDGAKLSA